MLKAKDKELTQKTLDMEAVCRKKISIKNNQD